MSVRCEDVRELLPRYAEWGPRPAGDVEVHLSTCADCGAELEVKETAPVALALAPEAEEDWGE